VSAPISARLAALRSLLSWERDGKYANLEIDAAVRRWELDGRERGLFTALVYGVIQWKTALDYVISLFSRRPPEKLDPPVLQILRMGVLQILYLDRVPDSAACDESVKLTRSAGVSSASSFVNAVLRQTVRQKDSIPYPDPNTEPLRCAEAVYGFPAPLAKRFFEHFGTERAYRMFSAFNRPAPITLRVNTLRTSRDELLRDLASAGTEAQPAALTETAIRLPDSAPVAELAALQNGLCFVQDEASQWCAHLLGALPDERVMDACACPGGKSFFLAMDMENRGTLLSLDLHRSKLSLIENGARRLGIDIIRADVHDGKEPNPAWFGAFDRVLCDVPCSGYGVIAKKPDLRHKSPTDTDGLPAVQTQILDTVSRYVRSGGTLVYSTCTVFPEENGDIVNRFLAAHPDFTSEAVRTFSPDTDGTDGFFAAKLHRN